jgi:hypothetical protein
MNRATITGSIDIGRVLGTVTVTIFAPVRHLNRVGWTSLVKDQYVFILE